ncbi:DUF6153 family protein [Ruania alba]|nr:DUF6153 family protein [Ruania alba]
MANLAAGTRRIVRTALILLAACVLFGLLAMHTLGLHGLGQHADTTTQAVPHLSAAAHDEGAPQHHSSAPLGAQSPAPTCDDCAESLAGAALGCVLALVLVALALLRPRVLHRWLCTLERSVQSTWSSAVGICPRPPSLSVLCISRT